MGIRSQKTGDRNASVPRQVHNESASFQRALRKDNHASYGGAEILKSFVEKEGFGLLGHQRRQECPCYRASLRKEVSAGWSTGLGAPDASGVSRLR